MDFLPHIVKTSANKITFLQSSKWTIISWEIKTGFRGFTRKIGISSLLFCIQVCFEAVRVGGPSSSEDQMRRWFCLTFFKSFFESLCKKCRIKAVQSLIIQTQLRYVWILLYPGLRYFSKMIWVPYDAIIHTCIIFCYKI